MTSGRLHNEGGFFVHGWVGTHPEWIEYDIALYPLIGLMT